jgi:hypothetical protein
LYWLITLYVNIPTEGCAVDLREQKLKLKKQWYDVRGPKTSALISVLMDIYMPFALISAWVNKNGHPGKFIFHSLIALMIATSSANILHSLNIIELGALHENVMQAQGITSALVGVCIALACWKYWHIEAWIFSSEHYENDAEADLIYFTEQILENYKRAGNDFEAIMKMIKPYEDINKSK